MKGLALVLGPAKGKAKDDAEGSDDEEAAESPGDEEQEKKDAFAALKEALDGGDAEAGIAAFELLASLC